MWYRAKKSMLANRFGLEKDGGPRERGDDRREDRPIALERT